MRLDRLTTEALAALLARKRCVVLLPVGSLEPHGPHLPLATDTMISQATAERAARRLGGEDLAALLAPPIPYGVTDYAHGFAGAVSVSASVLSAFLRSLVEGYLAGGFGHVCLINNHLEPAHDRAVRASIEGLGAQASVASPLTRRWGRTLSAEYKSGACHAGRYETSLVLAHEPESVDRERAAELASLEVSLSAGIAEGKQTFLEMGLDAAYTGAPKEATVQEGEALLDKLATMVEMEVREALAALDEES